MMRSDSLIPDETLIERCARLSREVAAYERDITNRTSLDLSAIRVALAEAVDTLDEQDRMLTELGS